MARARRRVRETPREAVARLLNDAGFRCDVTMIYEAKGYWRSNPYVDVVRWETWATHEATGMIAHIFSYSTMTACARRGIELSQDTVGLAPWEWWADAAKEKG